MATASADAPVATPSETTVTPCTEMVLANLAPHSSALTIQQGMLRTRTGKVGGGGVCLNPLWTTSDIPGYSIGTQTIHRVTSKTHIGALLTAAQVLGR